MKKMKEYFSNREAIADIDNIAISERVLIRGRTFERIPSGGLQCVSGSNSGMAILNVGGRSFARGKQGKHPYVSTTEG